MSYFCDFDGQIRIFDTGNDFLHFWACPSSVRWRLSRKSRKSKRPIELFGSRVCSFARKSQRDKIKRVTSRDFEHLSKLNNRKSKDTMRWREGRWEKNLVPFCRFPCAEQVQDDQTVSSSWICVPLQQLLPLVVLLLNQSPLILDHIFFFAIFYRYSEEETDCWVYNVDYGRNLLLNESHPNILCDIPNK